jgi:tetratricopeptide (TPR) repeat protein
MPPLDVNSLFSRAEQAFAAGRHDAARDDLLQVQRLAGPHPVVLHLLGLVEAKRGAPAEAKRAFEAALRLAPRDARIHGNYANFLADTGRAEDALAHYRRAIGEAPDFHEARRNRALLLQKLDRQDEALADLDAVAGARPGDAKVQSARGSVLRDLGRLREAAAAYDAALAREQVVAGCVGAPGDERLLRPRE